MNKGMRLLSFAVIALAALAVTPARADQPEQHPPPAKRAPYHPPAHPRAARPAIPPRPSMGGYYGRPGFAQRPGVYPNHGVARPVRPFAAPQWRGRADFRGRNIRTLRPEQQALWRGGGWHHARHQGRFGWWWVVGGAWYFYPAPVYPYPLYASTVVVFAPEAAAAPAGPPPARYWYYCGYPPGYYPYVPSCAIPWQPVPAAPE